MIYRNNVHKAEYGLLPTISIIIIIYNRDLLSKDGHLTLTAPIILYYTMKDLWGAHIIIPINIIIYRHLIIVSVQQKVMSVDSG